MAEPGLRARIDTDYLTGSLVMRKLKKKCDLFFKELQELGMIEKVMIKRRMWSGWWWWLVKYYVPGTLLSFSHLLFYLIFIKCLCGKCYESNFCKWEHQDSDWIVVPKFEFSAFWWPKSSAFLCFWPLPSLTFGLLQRDPRTGKSSQLEPDAKTPWSDKPWEQSWR